MDRRTPATGPRIIGVGGVFIDDIVLAGGETRMASLGGAAVHAMMGAVLWGERPGIVAPMGTGFPAHCRRFLDEHLDTRGLKQIASEHIRAWQILEGDGRRRELYRVDDPQPFIEGLSPGDLPAGYDPGAAFYLLQGFEGLRRWRAHLRGFVLWEPLQQVMVPGAREQLRSSLRECPVDLVSPNLDEARAVYGPLAPEALADAMLGDGAAAVALRLGAEGSLVAAARTRLRVCALPVQRVVDPTGAGNTYCGALLAGIAQGRPLAEAAAMGAVASSFCIEDWGVLRPGSVGRGELERRLAAARAGCILGA